MLEDKIQNPNKCLFRLSLGGHVMGQRSGDGRFGGRLGSIQGFTHFPNFAMLDAGIASSLNMIMQKIPTLTGRGVWRNRKAQKEDRFLRGRQIAHMIYEYFRVTSAHDTVLDYADLFTITLRNDNVQEFDTG